MVFVGFPGTLNPINVRRGLGGIMDRPPNPLKKFSRLRRELVTKYCIYISIVADKS